MTSIVLRAKCAKPRQAVSTLGPQTSLDSFFESKLPAETLAVDDEDKENIAQSASNRQRSGTKRRTATGRQSVSTLGRQLTMDSWVTPKLPAETLAVDDEDKENQRKRKRLPEEQRSVLESKSAFQKDIYGFKKNGDIYEFSTEQEVREFAKKLFEEFTFDMYAKYQEGCEKFRQAMVTALPFGARTLKEAWDRGLSTDHYHGHINTTSLSDRFGEFHMYNSNSSRNPIFSKKEDNGSLSHLSWQELIEKYGLKFIPLCRIQGSLEDDKDYGCLRAAYIVEEFIQSQFHGKFPMGTLGFRQCSSDMGLKIRESDRVCTVYFVYSERDLLQGVENNKLVVNRTRGCNINYNYLVWKPKTGHDNEETKDGTGVDWKPPSRKSSPTVQEDNKDEGKAVRDTSMISKKYTKKQMQHSDAKWTTRYNELVEYQKEKGNCLVPDRYSANPALGNWVDKQRHCYKHFNPNLGESAKGSYITQERIDKLNAIGFVWSIRTKKLHDTAKQMQLSTKQMQLSDAKWTTRYNELVEYQKEKGNCLVTKRYADNPALGNWVEKQRQCYKHFNPNSGESAKTLYITQERIDKLNAIGFVFGDVEARAVHDTLPISKKLKRDVWTTRYDELVEYKEKEGHCLVPQKYVTNPALGEWVKDQRKYYKRFIPNSGESTKGCCITQERIDKLNTIGFVWSIRTNKPHDTTKHMQLSDAKWTTRYNELVEYQKEKGNCLVPEHYSANPALGNWVAKQRHRYKHFNPNSGESAKGYYITQERIDKLNAIGFVFGVVEDAA